MQHFGSDNEEDEDSSSDILPGYSTISKQQHHKLFSFATRPKYTVITENISSASNYPSTHNSPIQSPPRSPSPINYTQQYQLKDFSIPLTNISKKLHLYQPVQRRRGRPRGSRNNVQQNNTISSRGRPRGRPRGSRNNVIQQNRTNSSRGRQRRISTSSDESEQNKLFDNEIIHINDNSKKIPTKVCRHLISHCTKKHPQNQDVQSYSPILIINDY